MTFTFPGWCSWWWGRWWWSWWWWWWRSWWSWIHNGFLSTEHCPFIDAQLRYPWSSLPLMTMMMKMMWFVKIKTMAMMKVVNKNALQSQNDNADNDDDDMTMRTSRIWEGKSQMNIRANQVWQADLICPIHPPHITHKPFIVEDNTILPPTNVKQIWSFWPSRPSQAWTGWHTGHNRHEYDGLVVQPH